MNIIRKYKINSLGYESFNVKELLDMNIILKYIPFIKENFHKIQFCYDNFLNLNMIKYISYYCHIKDDKLIFYYDIKNKELYIRKEYYLQYNVDIDTLIRILKEIYKYDINFYHIFHNTDGLERLINEYNKENKD